MSNWKHTIVGAEFEKLKLWQREQAFHAIVKEAGESFDEPPYAVVWEDPDDIDAPMKVTTPSPVWWAMALHGGILPPVRVYHELAADEARSDFKRHKRGYLLHETPPVGPMTEEEAMLYLIEKDVPPRVWRDYNGNRTLFRVAPRSAIPTDRSNRNAWQLKQEAA